MSALLAQAGPSALENFLTFSVFGVVLASVYFIAASGLVVTYTTTGIFNFAHGAVGMLGAFAYWQLRYDWGWPAPIALAVILLVVAPLFGAVVERVIMRGLEGVSEITSTVVTIGLLAMAIGIANIVWPSATSSGRRVDQFFAGEAVTIGAINVTWHRIVIVVVAVAVAVGLRFLLYRTRSGVAMRAVVDDRALSQLNGGNPGRSAMLSWGLGAALAALSGILISPLLQLSVLPLTLLIVNAYAAAMFGRLRSLPLTFAGGLIIGIAENYSANYLDLNTRAIGGLELAGLQPAIPVILLFVILIALPSERLRTGGVQRVREAARVPTLRSALLAGGTLVAVTIMAPRLMGPANVTPLRLGLATAVISLSL
ncbi:MAG TPA: branched-chain amino acid ABC transporter permease, partial [Acidimicrobiales bacterium]|nr:branched-chain amino acid ABC transporter permease [Acidimicrobiales bacterium]